MYDMLTELAQLVPSGLAITGIVGVLGAIWPYLLIFIGFSAVIFVHELGHFVVAKWCGVRVEKFAIGFFREVWGFTRGETRYSLNLLPLGGYVKMMGQEDFEIDKSGEIALKDDPRSFSNKTVGQRMAVISAGVIMNVLFAAVLFAIVFMIGLPGRLVTEVGYVIPDRPADLAGIRNGDRIVAVGDQETTEFNELMMAIALAPPLDDLPFRIERDGELRTLDLIPINTPDKGVQQVGIAPANTRRIVALGPEFDPNLPDAPQVDDKVVSINGEPVNDENANSMVYRMMFNPSAEAKIVVERSTVPHDESAPTKLVELNIPSRIAILPSDRDDPGSIDVLGLAPLTRVDSVDPRSRAWLAGIEPGDTILQWGRAEYPTAKQIIQETRDACRPRGSGTDAESEAYDIVERDIPIRVLRGDGTEVRMVVRPKVKRSLWRRLTLDYSVGLPQIGATFGILADNLLRIGNIVAEIDGRPTPAALSGIPAGATITHVNGERVVRWVQLVEALAAAAGTDATLTYAVDGKADQTCRFPVPESIRTRLGLPCYARITSINGEDHVPLTLPTSYQGEEREITWDVAATYWMGTRALLKKYAGRTVPVEYTLQSPSDSQTAEVAITEDMVDPWLGRVSYAVDLGFEQKTTTLRASNPIDALRIGAQRTYYFIVQVYIVMNRMIFSRSVGVENISGPVGIVKMGGQIAQTGLPQVLFFLAIISANLAVINFLPLPIVDGGHMVFLIIEKIKGSPVSIKVQMATQVVGLALIIAAFLFVTLQDLTR